MLKLDLDRAAYLVFLVAAAAAPFFVYPVLAMKILCFALFACAFNLLLGFTGLLSFGHAAFLGSAAYATGYAMTRWAVTPEIGIAFGTLIATALGAVFGGLAIRRQGIYFAMITLALAQMVYFFCLQAPITGGEDGLQGVPRGALFGLIDLGNDTAMYYFVLAVFLGGFWIVHRTVHSPFGQVLKAIRENEPRALSLGYTVDRYKLLAFVLSAALSGLAGATETLVMGFATLTDVHWSTSGEVVLMTLVGGVGTMLGPVVGAIVITALQSELADKVGPWVTVIMGAIFIANVLAFRRGIIGELAARLGSRP
ncbi:MAG TPA: branched-chain amino acid ABC transporter permease [Burkholderiales bacterium]|nr:branched-chain amino acid ABC transporter permease [Burkholderiales bacterium]